MMLRSIAFLISLTAVAGHAQISDCSKITIHVPKSYLPDPVYLTYAEKEAGRMLATAGVQVNWTTALPDPSINPCGAPIVVRFSVGEQVASYPRALAYSLPFNTEIQTITVFWDKLTKASARNFVPPGNLLAHVLAHEATHILQGMDYHSGSGMMRAFWTEKEYFQMLRGPLSFAAVDVQLVQAGIASRAARAAQLMFVARSAASQAESPLEPNRPPR